MKERQGSRISDDVVPDIYDPGLLLPVGNEGSAIIMDEFMVGIFGLSDQPDLEGLEE